MQGNGCPWFDKCKEDKTAFTENNYCTSNSRWHNCPNVANLMRDERLKKKAALEPKQNQHGLFRFIITLLIAAVLFWFLQQIHLL